MPACPPDSSSRWRSPRRRRKLVAALDDGRRGGAMPAVAACADALISATTAGAADLPDASSTLSRAIHPSGKRTSTS